jgi:RNA-directed DNA polymerase
VETRPPEQEQSWRRSNDHRRRRDYLREHWPSIRSQLLEGTYQPQPVKRVEIPKPEGGVRKLGVPCVVDRLIQQALLVVLQE